MTKEQAQERIAKLREELHGAVANVYACDLWRFWVLYVAKSIDETFPAWPGSEADDAENREKWHRLDEARRIASKRNTEITEELRYLYRIAEA